jgi:hypothetical protein
MMAKPIAFGACGALVGPKFETTVTRYEPGRPEEIITQADYPDTSVTNMAAVMNDLARAVVIPKQIEANATTGLNTKSAIITGWRPGDFFTGLDQVIRTYPLNDSIKNKFGNERDLGYIQQAVLDAYEKSGMGFKDYISACRAVAGNPLSQDLEKIEINPEWCSWISERIQNYSNRGEAWEESLKQLKRFMYAIGRETVINLKEYAEQTNNMRAFERMSRFDPNDPTVGNRFSLIDLRPYGGQELITLPGMRKALADGIRDELGFPKDKQGNHTHVLCPKVAGKDPPGRALTNVAGAILNQIFIKDGHMTIDELKAPYA